MIIIGDGGHARVVRELLDELTPKWTLDACGWKLSDDYVVIAIGDNAARKRKAETTKGEFPYFIHPNAIISPSADIGEGSVVMAGAIIGPNAKIGRFCIVNHGATCDHDCVIGDYAHIAPGAHLCGNVFVGEGTLVGVGVGIGPNTTIPAWSLVKAARLEIVPCHTK